MIEMVDEETEDSKGMKITKTIGDVFFGIGVFIWGLFGIIFGILVIPGLICGIIPGIIAMFGSIGAFVLAMMCGYLMPSYSKIQMSMEIEKRKKEAEKEAIILKAMEE